MLTHPTRLLAVSLLATATSAFALTYEGFTGYTDNVALATAPNGAGGTNWNAGWAASNNGFIVDTDTSLTYGPLVTSSGAVVDASITANQSYTRTSNETAFSASSANRWFSFLIRIDSLTHTTAAYSGSGTAADLVRVGLTSGVSVASNGANLLGMVIRSTGSGNSEIVARVGGTQEALNAGLALPAFGTTAMVVGKFSFNPATGTNDFVELWLNPDASLLGGADLTPGSLADGYTSVAGSVTSADIIGANKFVFNATGASAGNPFTGVFDEINIGDTFAQVSPTAIPEPSTFAALLGVAALAGASLRRRRA
jgi:hypothetical protein